MIKQPDTIIVIMIHIRTDKGIQWNLLPIHVHVKLSQSYAFTYLRGVRPLPQSVLTPIYYLSGYR